LQRQILKRSKEKWIKNITNYNRIYSKIRSEEAARIREQFMEKASKEIKSLSKNDLKLVGAALYWAEGNTKNKNRIQFVNSNPLMIRVIMRFFQQTCNIPKDKIKARIHIHSGTNYRKTFNFWSRITKLPKRNFYLPQTQISSASKFKRLKNTLPYGTINLTISNTELTSRVKGWIQGISEKLNAGVV